MKATRLCCLLTFPGQVFLYILFYVSYTSYLKTQQINNTETRGQPQEDIQIYKPILGSLKSYVQDQVQRNILQGAPSEFTQHVARGPKNNDDADAQRPTTQGRPEPAVVPVTSGKEECLPISKDLPVQPVNDHDCDQPYILMNPGGRLGNKMCQYASVYLLRHFFGVRVAITKSMRKFLTPVLKNVFLPEQESGCFTNDTVRIKFGDMYTKLYTAANEAKNKAVDKGLIMTPLISQSYYVFNNPAPRSLFMEHRELIRTTLRFKDEVVSRAIKNIDKAIKPYNATYDRRDFAIVTVHVRRTDYIKYIKKKYNMTELKDTYFQKAFDFYRKRLKKPLFLVVSDDRPWCTKNLAAHDVLVMGPSPPSVDMAIMSLGDHHITSYGTYSFMGALLGRGHITHPMDENKNYNVAKCLQSLYFHYISRENSFDIDNSHVKLQ